MKQIYRFTLILSVIIGWSSIIFAQSNQAEKSHILQLKRFYKQCDYEGGYEYGKKVINIFPDNLELQAWFVLNFTRVEINEATVYAENLTEKNKDNAWADFANSYALIRKGKAKTALPTAEKILKASPENEEFIFLTASALFESNKYDEALALLAKNTNLFKDKSNITRLKGEIFYFKSKDEKEQKAEELKKQSFDNFAEAQKIDPQNTQAFYYAGLYLNREKRFAEAAQVLKTAMRLSPESLPVRREFWKTILEGKNENIAPAKKEQLNQEITDFLKKKPDSSKALDAAYSTYRNAGMTKEKEEAEKKIITRFPDSYEAEALFFDRIHRFSYSDKDDKVDEKKRAESIKMMIDFFNRPKYFDLDKLESIYSKFFYTIKDEKSFSNQDTLHFAEKAVNEKHPIGAIFYPQLVYSLIERNLFAEAEKYARIGIDVTEETLKTRYDWAKDETIRQNFEKEFRNEMLGAFGKVLVKQKNTMKPNLCLSKPSHFNLSGNYMPLKINGIKPKMRIFQISQMLMTKPKH